MQRQDIDMQRRESRALNRFQGGLEKPQPVLQTCTQRSQEAAKKVTTPGQILKSLIGAKPLTNEPIVKFHKQAKANEGKEWGKKDWDKKTFLNW